MRVLMVTRLVDPEDRHDTGFAHDWIKALASRVEHVEVVCQMARRLDLPPNVGVTAVRGERHLSKPILWLAFQRAIWPRIKEADVVFAHFSLSYVTAAAPSAMLFGVPIVQWFTGGYVNRLMRVTHRLADRIVTASPESYRLPGKKVVVLGHGIDFERFVPVEPRPDDRLKGRVVVSVGRLAPVKDVESQIDAAALLLQRPGFDDVSFLVAGEESPAFPHYRATLEARIAQSGLNGRFHLLGGVPYPEIASYYQRSLIAVSTSHTGSIDKVVLEAMGCGLPTVVVGEAYTPLLGEESPLLWAHAGDPVDLADKLAVLLRKPPESLRALGLSLRARAVQKHDLGRLMDNLVSVFSDAKRTR